MSESEKITIVNNQTKSANQSSSDNLYSINNLVSSYPKWAKFVAIMHYIGAAFMLLGIFTIPLGIYMIFMGMNLWESANSAKLINSANQETKVDQNTYNLITNYSKYIKNSGIYYIISLIVAILFIGIYVFIGIVFLTAFISNSNSQSQEPLFSEITEIQ